MSAPDQSIPSDVLDIANTVISTAFSKWTEETVNGWVAREASQVSQVLSASAAELSKGLSGMALTMLVRIFVRLPEDVTAKVTRIVREPLQTSLRELDRAFEVSLTTEADFALFT